MVCGGIRLISGCVRSAGCGLGIGRDPVAGIRCGIGGNARERGATDIVAEGILEGGEDGGELDLWGIIEGGISKLLVVEIPGVVGARPVVRLRGEGGGGFFVLEGGDAACIGVWGGGCGGGHSSLGEVKVGLGTAMRQLPNRHRDKEGGKKEGKWVGAGWMERRDPPDSRGAVV